MESQSRSVVGNYVLGKVLAAGDFDCRTRLCKHMTTGVQYVVRVYEKRILFETLWMLERVKEAIHVMRTLPKHANIIEVVECFETESSLYILMQLFAPLHITKLYTMENPNGGKVAIPLWKTRLYFEQLVRAVLHMHDHNVVHLGIAPDHIMINEKDQVRIGNVVSWRYCPRGTKLTEMLGTMHTVAPEVLRGDAYNPYLADSWALGVVLFFMLNGGSYPHDGANTTKCILYGRIRRLNPRLPPVLRLQDLVGRLLHMSPTERMPVEEILQHPFMTADDQSIRENDGEAFTTGRTLPRTPSTFSLQEEYSNESTTASGIYGIASRALEANGSTEASEASAETAWDSVTDTLHIRLPYDLSREEEAAYIIQSVWRGYKQWSKQSSSWWTPPTTLRKSTEARLGSPAVGMRSQNLSQTPGPVRLTTGREPTATITVPLSVFANTSDDGAFSEPIPYSKQLGRRRQWDSRLSGEDNRRNLPTSVFDPNQSFGASMSFCYVPPQSTQDTVGTADADSEASRDSPISPHFNLSQNQSIHMLPAGKMGKKGERNSGTVKESGGESLSNLIQSGQRILSKKGNHVSFAAALAGGGALAGRQLCPACNRSQVRRLITDRGPFPHTPFKYTAQGFTRSEDNSTV